MRNRPVCFVVHLVLLVLFTFSTRLSFAQAGSGGLKIWSGPELIYETASSRAPITQLSAGQHRNLALRADGTVVGWGWPFNTSTPLPVGLKGVIQVCLDSVSGIAVALLNTGKVQYLDSIPPFSIPESFDRVIQISIGSTYLVGLRADGSVVTTAPLDPATSEQVAALKGIVQVSTSGGFTLALKSNGTVVAWGDNSSGQCNVPAGLTGVIQVMTGSRHAIALKSNGSVIAWGENGSNQSSVPAGLSSVAQIAAGGDVSAAIKQDGTVVAWGADFSGQTVVPANLGKVARISIGLSHVLALTTSGRIVAWGSNYAGQAISPSDLNESIQFGSNNNHSATLKSDGSYRIRDSYGDELSGTNLVALVTRTNHSLGLTKDGRVLAWGDNTSGQLDVPAGLTGVTQVATGNYHSLALKSDRTVVAWGNNDYGQSSVPIGLKDVKHIGAGDYFSVAVKTDGTVVAWGVNVSGQCDVPAGLKGVAKVAVGDNFTIALKTDGTVAGWGANFSSNYRIPTDLKNAVDVSAGSAGALVVKADGTLVGLANSSGGDVEKQKGIGRVSMNGTVYYPFVTLVAGTWKIPINSKGRFVITLPTPLSKDIDVAIESSSPMVAVPPLVRVKANSNSVSFDATCSGGYQGVVTLVAKYSGAEAIATMKVGEGGMVNFGAAPSNVQGDALSEGLISLDYPAPAGGHTFSLTSSNPKAASVPQTAVIAAGRTYAAFPIETDPVAVSTPVTITAKSGSITKTTVITVQPANLASITLTKSGAKGGVSIDGYVTLTGSAPVGGMAVSLTTSDSAIAVPTSVVVPSGSSYVMFSAKTLPVISDKNVTITANVGTIRRSVKAVVFAAKLLGFSINTIEPNNLQRFSIMRGGDELTATVTLDGQAPTGGVTVNVSNPSFRLDMPKSLIIPKGQSSATFFIGALSANGTGDQTNITVALGIQQLFWSILILRPEVSTVALNPTRVQGGGTSTGIIVLDSPAPPEGYYVTVKTSNLISSSLISDSPGDRVFLPAGTSFGLFTVKTKSVPTRTNVTISAFVDGNFTKVTQTALLTLLK